MPLPRNRASMVRTTSKTPSIQYVVMDARNRPNRASMRHPWPRCSTAQAGARGRCRGPSSALFGACSAPKDFGLEVRPTRPYGCPMSQLSSSLLALPRPLMAVGVAVTLLLAAAVALWVHYGTAVFYEMIAAGVAWCL